MNLVSILQSYLPLEVIQRASVFFGESESHTQKAADVIFPSVLGSLISKVSTTEGASDLYHTIQNGNFDGSLLANVFSLFTNDEKRVATIQEGHSLMEGVLGSDKLNSFVGTMASASGIKSASSASLVGILTPMVYGLLGRLIGSQGLNVSSLAALLLSQKDTVAKIAPAGLASILGLGSLAGLGANHGEYDTTFGSAITKPSSNDKEERKLAWLLPLLVLGIFGAMVWYSQRGTATTMPGVFSGVAGVEKAIDNHKMDTDSIINAAKAKAKMDSIKKAMDSAMNPAEPKKEEVTLAGGKKLNLEVGTINYELAKFLDDKKAKLPRTFVFDHLNFLSGKTELTPESKVTVENLVEIMKAYTAAEVELQGFTDNQGKVESNQKLSLNRAVAIKEMMTKMGVEAKRITKAEGFGQEKPMADNATEEGRAKNRRLELVVVKK